MKDHADEVVSDEAFAQRAERWPTDTPDTKEAYFIREVFEGTRVRVAVQAFPGSLSLPAHFPSDAAAETAVR